MKNDSFETIMSDHQLMLALDIPMGFRDISFLINNTGIHLCVYITKSPFDNDDWEGGISKMQQVMHYMNDHGWEASDPGCSENHAISLRVDSISSDIILEIIENLEDACENLLYTFV